MKSASSSTSSSVKQFSEVLAILQFMHDNFSTPGIIILDEVRPILDRMQKIDSSMNTLLGVPSRSGAFQMYYGGAWSDELIPKITEVVSRICSANILHEVRGKSLLDKMQEIMVYLHKDDFSVKILAVTTTVSKIRDTIIHSPIIEALAAKIHSVDRQHLVALLMESIGITDFDKLKTQFDAVYTVLLRTDALPTIEVFVDTLNLFEQLLACKNTIEINYINIERFNINKQLKMLGLNNKVIKQLITIGREVNTQVLLLHPLLERLDNVVVADINIWSDDVLALVNRAAVVIGSFPTIDPPLSITHLKRYCERELELLSQSIMPFSPIEILKHFLSKESEHALLLKGFGEKLRLKSVSAGARKIFVQQLQDGFPIYENIHVRNVRLFEKIANLLGDGKPDAIARIRVAHVEFNLICIMLKSCFSCDLLLLPAELQANSTNPVIRERINKRKDFFFAVPESSIEESSIYTLIKANPTHIINGELIVTKQSPSALSIHCDAKNVDIGELKSCSLDIIDEPLNWLISGLLYPLALGHHTQVNVIKSTYGNSLDITVIYINLTINTDGIMRNLGNMEVLIRKPVRGVAELIHINVQSPLIASALFRVTMLTPEVVEYLWPPVSEHGIDTVNLEELQKLERQFSAELHHFPPIAVSFLTEVFAKLKIISAEDIAKFLLQVNAEFLTLLQIQKQNIRKIIAAYVEFESMLVQSALPVPECGEEMLQLRKSKTINERILLKLEDASISFTKKLPTQQKFSELFKIQCLTFNEIAHHLADVFMEKLVDIDNKLQILFRQLYDTNPLEANTAIIPLLKNITKHCSLIGMLDQLCFIELPIIAQDPESIKKAVCSFQDNQKTVYDICYSLVNQPSLYNWQRFIELCNVLGSSMLKNYILQGLNQHLQQISTAVFFVNTALLNLNDKPELSQRVCEILLLSLNGYLLPKVGNSAELVMYAASILAMHVLAKFPSVDNWKKFLTLITPASKNFIVSILRDFLHNFSAEQMARFLLLIPNTVVEENVKAPSWIMSNLLLFEKPAEFIEELLQKMLMLKYADTQDAQVKKSYIRNDDIFKELAKIYMFSGFSKGEQTLIDYTRECLHDIRLPMERYINASLGDKACFRLVIAQPENGKAIETNAKDICHNFILGWIKLLFSNNCIRNYFNLLRNYLLYRNVDGYEASIIAFSAIINRVTGPFNDLKKGKEEGSPDLILIQVFLQVLLQFGLRQSQKGSILPAPIAELAKSPEYVVGMFARFGIDVPFPISLEPSDDAQIATEIVDSVAAHAPLSLMFRPIPEQAIIPMCGPNNDTEHFHVP